MDTSYEKGLRYEVIARAIFQQILDEATGVTVKVEHLAKVQGLRTHHDIDLLWEFEICGILYKAALYGSRRGPYERRTPVTRRERRGLTEDMHL
jgi:hypothetical protein